MSSQVAGTDTWHDTVAVPDGGDPASEVGTMGEGILDRTAWLAAMRPRFAKDTIAAASFDALTTDGLNDTSLDITLTDPDDLTQAGAALVVDACYGVKCSVAYATFTAGIWVSIDGGALAKIAEITDENDGSTITRSHITGVAAATAASTSVRVVVRVDVPAGAQVVNFGYGAVLRVAIHQKGYVI